MGTSTSFRSPLKPRWQAFVTALSSDQPIERVRSELFNAGNEWQAELSSSSIAVFAQKLAGLFESFSALLEVSHQLSVVLSQVVVEARDASVEAAFSPALPVAERAFAKVIMRTLLGTETESFPSGPELAETWRAQRGTTERDLLGKYLGELLAEYTRHVLDREAGRLSAAKDKATRNKAEVVEALSSRAIEIGTEAAAGTDLELSLAEGWRQAVNSAFDIGRSLGHA